MRLFGPSEKDVTLRLLKQLSPKCPNCKFYCRSLNVTCKTEHEACTVRGEEINTSLEISCREFQDRIKDVDIQITAADGSTIINTIDLVHIFEEKKINFIVQREGIDLKSRERGTIKYYIELTCET